MTGLSTGKIAFDDGLPVRVFWTTLYQTVVEGMYSDPIYGGNRNKAGWAIIGFPGVIAVHRDHVAQYRGKPYPEQARRHRGHELGGTVMTTKLKEVDVVIVGLGWTGGILAKELTEAGLEVVALERGAMRTTENDYAVPNIRDELRYVVRHDLMQTPRATLTVRNNPRRTRCRCGGSVVPARRRGRRIRRALERPHLALDRHGVQGPLALRAAATARSFIPEDMTIQDWGMTYEELEPYYDSSNARRRCPARPATLRGKIRPGATRSRRRAPANIRCRR